MINNVSWENPEFLYLLLIIPLAVVWYWFKEKNANPEFKVSSSANFQNTKKTFKYYFRHSLFILRLCSLVFLILALARPQTKTNWQNITTEGIDVMIAFDVSGSMLAEDFKPNRLEAAKKLSTDFISKRKSDRIGLVIFSGVAFTQSPLTTDHNILKNLFMDVKNGMIEDGTAIGMGLATSINRLKESDAVSKIVVLLTDGVNNRGSIAPLTAAEIAKEFGIRVYTIGIGTKGKAPYPYKTPLGTIQYQYEESDVDEETLTKIAQMTGGEYYRATENKSLEDIYTKIDLLEKSKLDVVEYKNKTESFLPLVVLALIFISLEILFRNTILKTIP
jgi:Ca-activated chloride channel homolog